MTRKVSPGKAAYSPTKSKCKIHPSLKYTISMSFIVQSYIIYKMNYIKMNSICTNNMQVRVFSYNIHKVKNRYNYNTLELVCSLFYHFSLAVTNSACRGITLYH